MKIITGKTDSKLIKGFYSSSCVPNHKTKRLRKMNENKRIILRLNGIGIAASIFTIFCLPLNVKWKIGISILFILSSFHVDIR
jgi:hypothetical protein